jgi:hypothetical protein
LVEAVRGCFPCGVWTVWERKNVTAIIQSYVARAVAEALAAEPTLTGVWHPIGVRAWGLWDSRTDYVVGHVWPCYDCFFYTLTTWEQGERSEMFDTEDAAKVALAHALNAQVLPTPSESAAGGGE